MVRLWTLEAFAHGSEVVSYFRWRQAPFAQEQMHSGLLRSNGEAAEGYFEVGKVLQDIKFIDWPANSRSQIAIVFDYASAWAWKIQPQGAEFDYFRLIFEYYKGLRELGLLVDFVSAEETDLSAYQIVIVAGLFAWSDQLVGFLKDFDGEILIGPRSGSKTGDFSIPQRLAPDLDAEILDLKIARVESLRPDVRLKCPGGKIKYWFEHGVARGNCRVVMKSSDGLPVLVKQANWSYICGWSDE